MTFDASRKEIVLFGGYSPQSAHGYVDTWAWDGTDWTQKEDVGPRGAALPRNGL